MQNEEDFQRELAAGFSEEAQELILAATQDLINLETAAQDRAVRGRLYASLARNLHTLKGSAATCSLDGISDLAHRMEGALAPFKEGCLPFTPECSDLLLAGMDSISEELTLRALGRELDGLERARQALGARLEPGAAALRPEPGLTSGREDLPAPEELPIPAREEGAWRVGAGQVLDMIRQVERLRELSGSIAEHGRALGRLGGSSELHRGLKEDSTLAGELCSELEERLKVICMAPLGEITDPLRRMVRDLCRRLGKAAQLSVVGAEIRVDRRLLEALRGALVHLIRNALDHGLEAPEERDRLGKHHEGTLVIRAEMQGNRLFIEFSDDGAGIDPARVREAALRRGLASQEELAGWDRRRLLRCLFTSGFSMAEKVTDLSGRGVGLDAVDGELSALGGSVELDSRPGEGTRFTLSMPMEIGSVPVLLLRSGPQTFGLPLLVVDAVLKVKPGMLQLDGAQTFVRHRERAVPLRDLAELLGLRLASTPRPGQPLLVVGTRDQSVALLVDEVLGSGELAPKPLPGALASLAPYQGVSQNPGGEPVLLLRQEWLVDPASGPLQRAGLQKRAIVVDDSLAARAMHRAMLESAGYLVNTAPSADEALGLLGLARYDVLICDIGMQGMDGFALLGELRGRSEFGGLPVVMVSASEDEADRARALKAGAQAFLSKRDCASGRLLEEVASALELAKGGRLGAEAAAAGGR